MYLGIGCHIASPGHRWAWGGEREKGSGRDVVDVDDINDDYAYGERDAYRT